MKGMKGAPSYSCVYCGQSRKPGRMACADHIDLLALDHNYPRGVTRGVLVPPAQVERRRSVR